ncbi:MAG: 4Fe-4S dicluster domain-containing protein [Firmicutes bacterium]|nr:4Fe-4S dicluster domain-containing protein [Bacillota bacterium]
MAGKLDEPQGRGEFFKSLGTLFAGFVAQRMEDMVLGSDPGLLRPPGALEEFEFLTACTRCDKCIRACPQDTLQRATGSARFAVGTPYLEPRLMPCYLCTELPCIPACPEGALVWPRRTIKGVEVEGPAAVRLGFAAVDPGLCLTWPSEEDPAEACRTCVDRCPYPGEAIRMVDDPEGGPAHPVVDEEVCTGCGLCEYGCPTAKPAIRVKAKR